MSPDLSGKTLGQYKIIKPLGRGGMATVYLAQQPSINRQVAVKIMPASFLHDSTFLERFNREVQVIARLQHPRILPVYDYGRFEDQPYIVMAYMSGGTLADRIKAGRMSLDEAVPLVEQIAEGLDHAHRKGVIHRDFKPSNVLLDEHGNVYLADFGIAKVNEMTAQLTGSAIIGTPTYMAPEMAEHGDLTGAIDVYAVGVTLFQMLTGRVPYRAETPLRVLIAHANQPIPNVLEHRPDLPAGVQAVIERAMAKKPGERYQTVSRLAADLKTAAQGKPAPAPSTAAPASTQATPAEKTSKAGLWIALAAAGLIAICLVGLVIGGAVFGRDFLRAAGNVPVAYTEEATIAETEEIDTAVPTVTPKPSQVVVIVPPDPIETPLPSDTPIPTDTPLPSDTPTLEEECPSCFPTRLEPGDTGRIVINDGIPLRMRDQPGFTGSEIIAVIAQGTEFVVLEGPECKTGWWYRIEAETGHIGWVLESDTEEYLIEPYP